MPSPVANDGQEGCSLRALGVGSDVEVDRRILAVEAGDRLVVCTVGLFNKLSHEELANPTAVGGDVAEIVEDLIEVVVAEVAAGGITSGLTLPSVRT